MKRFSKLIIAILLILILVINIVYQLVKNESAPLVIVEHENDQYTTLESSYCWDGTLNSICVDTIDPKDFEYENFNASIDANVGDVINIVVPDVFDQQDMRIIVEEKDIDNIYSFTLTSDRGDVTYHFFIK